MAVVGSEALRRRRSLAVSGAIVLVLLVWGVVRVLGGGGNADSGARAAAERPAELPRGGRIIFPRYRVVAFYGAPQDPELGALGIGSPRAMARRLERQARPYATRGRAGAPAAGAIPGAPAVASRAGGPFRPPPRDAPARPLPPAARPA